MEDRVAELERQVFILENQLKHYKERLDQIEKPLATGRKISMLPVSVRGFHPIRSADQPSPDEVLLAVTIGEKDLQAPVIRIARSILETFSEKKAGEVLTLEDYIQLPEMAQKKACLKGGWEWRLLA